MNIRDMLNLKGNTIFSIAPDARVAIRLGGALAREHSRPLFDYFTLINLYQPCASLTEDNA